MIMEMGIYTLTGEKMENITNFTSSYPKNLIHEKTYMDSTLHNESSERKRTGSP